MLPKAQLTSHSGMSGSTPSWLSGSLTSFLYSSSVYSCHLFLVSSASVRSLPFLSFIVPLVAPILLSNLYFLQFYYFPLILAVFTYEDFLIFPCYSPELCTPLCISFFFSFAFHFSYFLSCFKASSGNPIFSHIYFSWEWFW